MPKNRLSPLAPSKFWIHALFVTALSGSEVGTIYHVDPATGSMSNPGTSSQPWSTLEAVFAANKSFEPGDVIQLRSGYHGSPNVKGNNSGEVFIQPASGATPKLKTLLVNSGSRWVIEGLDICPEHQSPGTSTGSVVVEIEDSASRITLRNCRVRSAFDVTSWSRSNWDDRGARGIRTAGSHSTIENNRVEGATHALTVRRTGSFTVVSGNTIKGFSHDGIVALADDCLYEYNTVTDAYISDNSHNHDDFFQSWSVASNGYTVGEGTVARVTVRGNTFISRTDPNQALPANPQGIGLFDGYFEDWVIENNVIATGTYHGISLYGAINCKVVNNTVVENPMDTPGASLRPWIKVTKHKTRSTPSSGNLVRNNISTRSLDIDSGTSTVSHNLSTTSYSSYFANHTGFDFSLKAGSPAVDAGSADGAPAIDIMQVSRSLPIDVGAYTFETGGQGQTYQQWLAANNLPTDGSGDGAPGEDPNGDGVSNEMKFALGLPVDSDGYAGRVTTGTHSSSGQEYLSLTYTRPEPAPAGTSYAVKGAADFAVWSPGVETSNTVDGNLRTITVRDTVAIGSAAPRRFIRLEVNAP